MRTITANEPAVTSAKTVLVLNEGVLPLAIAEGIGLLDGTPTIGGDGAVTGTVGSRTITVADAAVLARAAALDLGTRFYVYNTTTRDLDSYTIQATDAGLLTITTREDLTRTYEGTSNLITLNPPWYDTWKMTVDGMGGGGVQEFAIVFTDTDPSTLTWANWQAFDKNHVLYFKAQLLVINVTKEFILPRSACPSAYIALVTSQATWAASPIGMVGLDYLALTLHHTRVSASSHMLI